MNFYGFVSNHPVNIHDLLGLASNDDKAKKISECEAAKKIALNTAEVKPYLDKINSHKPPCPFAPKCDCCEREGEEGNTSANGTVVICANESVDKERAVKVLMHELTHVIQNCFDEPMKDPCDNCLCREIQAYMTDPNLKGIDPDALKKILATSAAGSCMWSKEGGGYTAIGCGIKYQTMQDAIDHALKLVDQCSKSPL